MSSSSLPIPASDHAVPSRPVVKRRKVRKGTFSCWECKHRKTRCEFKPASGSVCVSCQRRGLPCISQEFPDTVESGYEEVEKGIIYVEALVSQLVQQRRIPQHQGHLSQLSPRASTSVDDEITEEPSPSTPDTTRPLSAVANNDIRIPPSSLLAAGQDPLSICRSLSGYLHSILPNPTIAALILSRGKFFSLSFQVLRQPLKTIPSSSTSAEQLAQVSELPPPTAHPVLFARKLIQLALCLQQLDTSTSEQPELRLNESVCDAARRYIDIASRHVTSQDLLVGSLDGLETLMLETCYHINVGKLRVAWLILRRALGIAQLMGLPQLAEKAGPRVESVWFRLIYSDRFLSLMLGLPFAVADNSFASEHLLAANVPSERLERIHVVVVGRIITRNLRMQHRRHRKESENNAYDDFKETQDIDYELKQATRSLPANWWVPPTLYNVTTDVEAMEKTGRLLTQMHQYYLLVLLHHPYLIPDPQSTTSIAGSSRHSVDYTYSKLAVLSASREVLSRFLVVRNFHRAPSYRGLDDKAFTASMALLLAHLDGHRLGRLNVLEHQRPHDLGIIHNVIDCMEEISCLDKDVSSNSSAQVLRNLMEIEADAADGANYFAWSEEGAIGEEDCRIRKEHGLQLSVPYFGTISIGRKGLKRPQLASPDPDSVRMAELAPGVSTATGYNDPEKTNGDSPFTIGSPVNGGICASDLQLQPLVPTCAAFNLDNDLTLLSPMRPSIQDMSQPSAYTPQEISLLEHTVDAQGCPYQEMDTAFFSTWMQGETETDETLVETEIQPVRS